MELHGSVVHRSPLPTVALYAALLALCAWASALWLLPCLLLFLVVLLSALRDLDGGEGVLRSLVARDVGQALLAWCGRADAGEGADASPRTLVLLPAELRSPGPAPGRAWLLPLLVLTGLVGVGLPLRYLLPEGAQPFLAWTGLGCMLACLVALGLEAVRRRREPVGSERVVMGLLRRLRTAPPGNSRVAVACLDDGMGHFDGTEILLLNNRSRLDPARTRVLAWRPGPGPLSQVGVEGRVRKLAADQALARVAGIMGLPKAEALTAASRAMQLGWPAMGLVGGADAPDQVVVRLHALILGLDRQAAGGREDEGAAETRSGSVAARAEADVADDRGLTA